MKVWCLIVMAAGVLVAIRPVAAQTPLASGNERAVDATAGNQVLQLRYLGG
ncbi:MAG: hypothetical protein JWL65_5777, partial [Gammaproteobacteria bacterium]|nr:hypothetical protein [Gammaproteobacteria bacterium]